MLLTLTMERTTPNNSYRARNVNSAEVERLICKGECGVLGELGLNKEIGGPSGSESRAT